MNEELVMYKVDVLIKGGLTLGDIGMFNSDFLVGHFMIICCKYMYIALNLSNFKLLITDPSNF